MFINKFKNEETNQTGFSWFLSAPSHPRQSVQPQVLLAAKQLLNFYEFQCIEDEVKSWFHWDFFSVHIGLLVFFSLTQTFFSEEKKIQAWTSLIHRFYNFSLSDEDFILINWKYCKVSYYRSQLNFEDDDEKKKSQSVDEVQNNGVQLNKDTMILMKNTELQWSRKQIYTEQYSNEIKMKKFNYFFLNELMLRKRTCTWECLTQLKYWKNRIYISFSMIYRSL